MLGKTEPSNVVSQLVKKTTYFYVTRKFIEVSTQVHHFNIILSYLEGWQEMNRGTDSQTIQCWCTFTYVKVEGKVKVTW